MEMQKEYEKYSKEKEGYFKHDYLNYV